MSELIDIIYCYRDREPNRIKASMASLDAQENKNFKVTFIDYGSSDENSNAAKEICKQFEFCTYFYINSKGKMWNRGDALNHGILLSKGEHLFFSDIDMLFLPGFTDQLQKFKLDGKIHFFTVGYLNNSTTIKAKKGKLSTLSYTKSEAYATGMLLAPRKALSSVNGYNTFYSLWGLEDNDLKRRFELAGFKTQHVSTVWMLHQFHQPVPESQSLPEGWIQFMKDHYHYQSNQKTNLLGLTHGINMFGRPAEEQFVSGKLQYKNIEARRLFLRYILLNAISVQGTSAFKIKVMAPEKNGLVHKHNHLLSKWMKRLGLHVQVKSLYAEQYLSEKEIVDEIYFVVKTFSSKIVDYFIHQTRDYVQLVVVTR